jgi:hypothetical protein
MGCVQVRTRDPTNEEFSCPIYSKTLKVIDLIAASSCHDFVLAISNNLFSFSDDKYTSENENGFVLEGRGIKVPIR